MVVGLVLVGEVLPLVELVRLRHLKVRSLALLGASSALKVGGAGPRLHNDQVGPEPGQEVTDEHEGGQELEEGDGHLSLADAVSTGTGAD